jgi:hypothetical protein
MLPPRMENFEPNNNQVVVNQIVTNETPYQVNRNTNALVDKPVLSDTLSITDTINEISNKAENEKPSTSPLETRLQSDDSKIKLSELTRDEVEPLTANRGENDATTSSEKLVFDNEENTIRNTDNDIYQVDDTNIGHQENDADISTIDLPRTRVETENAKDSLLLALKKYRTEESKTKLTEEFVKELIAFVKEWVQFVSVAISNDPLMISISNYVKDSFRMVEISVQIVNDRLPSDLQPFLKGFLLGTLILNVFNEGQRYKEGVYTMYADENGMSIEKNDETDFAISEPRIMSNETSATILQPWIEEIENNDASRASDEENESVAGEVKALAEVLISKRIVKELLQKKKETQKPFFATSINATSEKQTSSLPQPPLENPPIELFDTNLRVLVDKTVTDNDSVRNSRSTDTGIPISTEAVSKRWISPLQRKSAREAKYKNDVPAEVKANGFISWMKNIAESFVQPSPEKALDSIPEGPSQYESNLFDFSNTKGSPESWANSRKFGLTNEISSDYDVVTPSAVDKIFNSGDFSYGVASSLNIESGSADMSGDFDAKDNPFTSDPSPSLAEGETSGNFGVSPPMQLNNELQGPDLPEYKTDDRIAPFNIPVSNNSAKTDTQWPPSVKRTSYRSTNEDYDKMGESNAVEFNSPFGSYESQYARFSNSSPSLDNLGTASTSLPSKFEFTPPIEYEATFSALNIYTSESTPVLDSIKEDQANAIPPDQQTLSKSNNYEYPEQIPVRNTGSGNDEPKKFEFPAPPNFEPTFSALSIYGEQSTESPPEADPSLELNFQSQEYVEPTFSALSIYSVAPENNDVAKVSNTDTKHSSVDALPNSKPSNLYSNASFENQENTIPMPIDSKSNSEPSFNLADLFNETSAMQDAEKKFELQEAVSIPIADVLPPNFQVDIEAADSSQTNPYDKVSMFSILPDMNDIFSAKPSYNPYPTRQPKNLEIDDLRNDAIDTPIDTNPTYQESFDSFLMLPQEVLRPPASNESSTSDHSFADQYNDNPDVPKSEHEQSNGLATHEAVTPNTAKPAYPVVEPLQEAVPSKSNRSAKANLPSTEQDKTTNRTKPTIYSATAANLSYTVQFDLIDLSTEVEVSKAENPSTYQSSESLAEKVPEQNRTNESRDNPIDMKQNRTDDSDPLTVSPQVETTSVAYLNDSTQSDDPSTNQSCDNKTANVLPQNDKANDLNVPDNVDTRMDYNETAQDNSVVLPTERTKTDVSATLQNSEKPNDYEYTWDDEPFQ